MRHIKQHNNHSCVIASIAMLTDGVSYRSIKNYCRKHFGYSVAKSTGCCINQIALVEFLESLGHKVIPIEDDVSGTIKSLSKYGMALLFLYDEDGQSGHAVAWDGCRIFDPHINQPYSEDHLFKNYKMDTLMTWLIVIETPPLKRVANIFKCWYYNLCTG